MHSCNVATLRGTAAQQVLPAAMQDPTPAKATMFVFMALL